MREARVDGRSYRVPDVLNQFQEEMYVHLINWKRVNITRKAGINRGLKYDAILPEFAWESLPHIYEGILQALEQHKERFPFKFHKHFYHMVSSQAANINLFLPLLLHPQANSILKRIKPDDFHELATDELDRGFQLEFWGAREGKGLLNDHNSQAGTDADIAIAYYNRNRELCLWLIEHKLTEKEFTPCGGFESNRKQPYQNCDCRSSFSSILANPDLCYYHVRCKYKYWELTRDHDALFRNHGRFESCPFRSGMNQLWRNQLLGLAVESEKTLPYEHVYFSVVKHPGNRHLDKTINQYRTLIADSDRFSVFTSLDVVNAAAGIVDPELSRWVAWYRDLYKS